MFNSASVTNPDGLSLSEAIGRDNVNALELLFARRRKIVDNLKDDALCKAALRRSMECLKFLLEYGDSYITGIDTQTLNGATTLHLDVSNVWEENVEPWLRACDPRVKALKNYSALFLAVRTDNSKLVEALLNYPRAINYAGFKKRTPLHLSAGFGHFHVTRILLEKGADPRFTDTNRQLPLHYACLHGHFDTAQLLIKGDSSTVNHQDNDGTTPLMLAVKSRDSATVRMLLENGAKQELCNRKGRIALHFAAQSGDAGVLELLLQYADASCVEKCISHIPSLFKPSFSLHSPICCAIRSENIECLKLLTSYLPKILLQMPHIKYKKDLYSPLTYLFVVYEFDDERLNAFLQVLLKHGITTIHDFFRQSSFNWLSDYKRLHHPFSFVVDSKLLSSQKQYYFNLLCANDVTIDYCLQCYNDNSQPFSSFTEYRKFYYALWKALLVEDTKMMKLMISSSAILEPDQMIAQFIELPRLSEDNDWISLRHALPDLYSYLISLKPIYFLKQHRMPPFLPDYPRFSLEEEFSKSSLQQLCRTVIRHHVRDFTLEDNLRNFKRKIMELPLPMKLRDYLLFKN